MKGGVIQKKKSVGEQGGRWGQEAIPDMLCTTRGSCWLKAMSHAKGGLRQACHAFMA